MRCVGPVCGLDGILLTRTGPCLASAQPQASRLGPCTARSRPGTMLISPAPQDQAPHCKIRAPCCLPAYLNTLYYQNTIQTMGLPTGLEMWQHGSWCYWCYCSPATRFLDAQELLQAEWHSSTGGSGLQTGVEHPCLNGRDKTYYPLNFCKYEKKVAALVRWGKLSSRGIACAPDPVWGGGSFSL